MNNNGRRALARSTGHDPDKEIPMSKSTPKSTLSPAVPATTEFEPSTLEAMQQLRACLASLEAAHAVLARLKALETSNVVMQHVRDSAGAAFDGLLPEIDLVRADVALLPVDTQPPAGGAASAARKPPQAAGRRVTGAPQQPKVLRGWPTMLPLRIAA